jgi:hypothetical protein
VAGTLEQVCGKQRRQLWRRLIDICILVNIFLIRTLTIFFDHTMYIISGANVWWRKEKRIKHT